MALIITPAIVLSALRYSETSKIVRLATREHGVQSAIAKGALRPKSRFGGALQLMSEGQAQYLAKEHRELHLLTAFDLGHLHVGLAADLARYATAAALAEVMLRFAPPDPHPESYDLFRDALHALEAAAPADLEPLGFRVLWHLVSVLGFAPSLDACVRDGTPLPERRHAAVQHPGRRRALPRLRRAARRDPASRRRSRRSHRAARPGRGSAGSGRASRSGPPSAPRQIRALPPRGRRRAARAGLLAPPAMGGGMIIGTAGHIDHGKSALVAALTGRPMDRLAEEKRRGITIDLNFAPLQLPRWLRWRASSTCPATRISCGRWWPAPRASTWRSS